MENAAVVACPCCFMAAQSRQIGASMQTLMYQMVVTTAGGQLLVIRYSVLQGSRHHTVVVCIAGPAQETLRTEVYIQDVVSLGNLGWRYTKYRTTAALRYVDWCREGTGISSQEIAGTGPSGEQETKCERRVARYEGNRYLLQVICMLGGGGIGVHVLRHRADLPLLHCLD